MEVLVQKAAGHVTVGHNNHTWEAWLDLYWFDPQDYPRSGDQMGELITIGMSPCEAIQNMIGFTRTLGYDGPLYFRGSEDEDYGSADCSTEPPKFRIPHQLQTGELQCY